MISNSGTSTLGLYDFKIGIEQFGQTGYWVQKTNGYPINKRIMLTNGYIVKSTVDGNTNDPNVDMTGWMFDDNTVESIADLIAIQNPKDGQVKCVKSYHTGVNKGGGYFVYESAKSTVNDGGIVINGWVRQGFDALDPYMFGAYGDWNAYTQNGADDTVPIQKCVDWLANNIQNVRAGGSPIFKLKSGNYRLSSLNIPRGIRGFGLLMKGEGETSQLWFDPTGNGISVDFESSKFDDIVFNGNLAANNTNTIPYIFKFKKFNKTFDIDAKFTNCDVRFFDKFAKVSGRGFVFNGGSVVYGNALCEISLDSDIVAGSSNVYTLNTQEAARHYIFSGARTDALRNVFTVTGAHAAKEFVNGVSIFANEFTGMSTLIYSTDCRLVQPSIQNNEVINGFSNSSPQSVIDVPRAVNVKDIGNRWNNRIGDELPSTDATACIPVLYRFSDYVDGFKMIGSTAKNISSAVLLVGSNTSASSCYINNVKISDCELTGFGDVAGLNGGIINFADTVDIASKLKNIKIHDNNIQSNNSKYCYWFNQSMTGLTAFNIRGNKYNALFNSELITFVPQFLVGGAISPDLSLIHKTGTYSVNGDYIECDVFAQLSTTLTSGVLTMQLPVPAKNINSSISSAHSGTGMLEYYTGFNFTQPIFIKVNAASQQNAEFYQNGASLNLSSKTNSNILMQMRFKYKFK